MLMRFADYDIGRVKSPFSFAETTHYSYFLSFMGIADTSSMQLDR